MTSIKLLVVGETRKQIEGWDELESSGAHLIKNHLPFTSHLIISHFTFYRPLILKTSSNLHQRHCHQLSTYPMKLLGPLKESTTDPTINKNCTNSSINHFLYIFATYTCSLVCKQMSTSMKLILWIQRCFFVALVCRYELSFWKGTKVSVHYSSHAPVWPIHLHNAAILSRQRNLITNTRLLNILQITHKIDVVCWLDKLLHWRIFAHSNWALKGKHLVRFLIKVCMQEVA